MSDFTLTSSLFADGTPVGAYDATGYPNFPGKPPGSPVATAVVAAGSVAFTGLTDHTAYFAAAQVGGVWRGVRFTPGENGPPPRFPEDVDFAGIGPSKLLSVNAGGDGYEFVDGVKVSTSDFLVVVEHGADPTVARPEADFVLWRGSVEPENMVAGKDDWRVLP